MHLRKPPQQSTSISFNFSKFLRRDFIEFLRLVDNEEAALLWSLALGQQFTDADRERLIEISSDYTDFLK